MPSDVFTREKRSDIMRRIRSKNTSWEVNFRRVLWRRGLRYRVHYGPHRIDIAFVPGRLAVFLDSCFWHFCPRHREVPVDNRAYWLAKLQRNFARDKRVTEELQREGWSVLRLWSHDFILHPEAAADRVASALARAKVHRK